MPPPLLERTADRNRNRIISFPDTSVAEPHHFYAAPGSIFDAAPTLLYSKEKFLKRTKV
jgi:hypothetical protein